jgi:D-3-phosphoglycerate dehydrogenase / 2-oxoglutarate reductase
MTLTRPRVVITDCDHGTTAPEEEILAGHADVEVHQQSDEPGLLELCRNADGIITQYGRFTRQVIAGLTRCRVIARYGVGVDTVDLQAATDHGVVVVNVPDYCIDEVSNHAIGLILALNRKIVRLDTAIRQGTWDFRVSGPLPRLAGLTLGLVGVGRIGSMVAEKLRPFRLTMLAADPYAKAFPEWVRPVPLEELLPRSDVLSLHCPLTEETRHLIDESALRRMKDTALLINTARGALVDTAALVQALHEGWIAGAGIDVLEDEPLARDHPLVGTERAVLTPHSAWNSEGSVAELKRRVAISVLDVLEGNRPGSVVNPEVLDRARRA